MSELENLKAENEKLKQVLQEQINYHHHIGNEDCPYSTNQILCHLYESAANALKETQYSQF